MLACSGSGPGSLDRSSEEGEACAARTDCVEGLDCLGPDDPQVCGIPPREECTSNEGCVAPSVCHAIYDACSADGQGSECGPPCSAGTCGAGFRCGTSGACEAIPCEAGDCAEFEVCDPAFAADTPVFDFTSGCRPIPCDPEADACPGSTVCVNGQCQSAFGSCGESIAVP